MSMQIRKKLSNGKISELVKYQNDLKKELNMTQTFAEYFLIIGIDPRISMRNYLYDTDPNEILKFYSNEIKPEILSKFPPMNKNNVNVDNSIIDICFPNNFNLYEFSSRPEPEIFYFILDNSFYSIDYPYKFITCLKFYESLDNYHKLKVQLQKILGKNYDGKIPKYDGGVSNNERFLDFDESDEDLYANLSYDYNKSYELEYNVVSKRMNDKIKRYYFPKIICFISLKPFYKEQELILRQLYHYYLNNEKNKIPIEKILLNILCNIPMPPNGLFEISYKFNNDENEKNKIFNEIKIKQHKYNELKNIDYYLNIMLTIFNVDNIIEIFKYSIYEIKTIIFSSKINDLCFFINGILSMLYPFQYSFQVSSCVPNNAFDVLESISPYLFGINQKYTESFFIDNKIEIEGEDLMIIDIDSKKLIFKIKNKENYPDFPRPYFKKLKSGLEECMKKQKTLNKEEKLRELNLFSSIFFDLFLSILNDYSNFLNKDYFVNKLKYKNSNIQGLFKINEFINNHYSNERAFCQKLVSSQMFSDFIFKKMLPKNINDKMDILFLDESINKKNNDKILLFGKKKALYLLTSKEYHYKHIYIVPKVKELSKEEKYRYEDKLYKLKNLYLGQFIENEYNNNTEENDFIFNYTLFPILNNDYFYEPNYDYFFTTMTNDIERINTDILSKSNKNSIEGNEEEMLNYIYLAYIELWGYSYYYQSLSEKDYRFDQLLSVLDKVFHHEIEIFNLLFESLNKFHEIDKLLKLYERLLSYKINPSNYIYSIISKIIEKDKINIKSDDKNSNDIEKYLRSLKNKSNILDNDFQRRIFRSENEKNIFGDLVIFKTTQNCPECGKLIDIEEISMNFRNMKKDSFWAQCPFCNKYIIPKLNVKLGKEINNGQNPESNSKPTNFILHSPYELKVNLKEIIDKDRCQFLVVEKFKTEYPSLFWSCIWYFRLNKLDYDIMLPYESNIFEPKINTNFKYFQNNIKYTINYDKIEDIKKYNNKLKKVKRKKDILIIQSIFSFCYIKNKFYNFYYGNIKKEHKDLNINRRKTYFNFSRANNHRTISGFLNSIESENNKKIENDKDFSKTTTMKEKAKKIYLDD